jgi:hypothetical protein
MYTYKNCNYKIDKVLLDGFETTVFNNKDSIKGFLEIALNKNNTVEFRFTGRCLYPANPLSRITRYAELAV